LTPPEEKEKRPKEIPIQVPVKKTKEGKKSIFFPIYSILFLYYLNESKDKKIEKYFTK
jgi:hypothetical protein